MEQKCSKCGRLFNPTPYQIRKSDHICKPCRYKRDKAWREKRNREGRPVAKGKASKAWTRDYYAKYYANPKVKARRAEQMRRYRRDPIQRAKHEARWIANHAVESKKIMKLPCAECGAENAQKHHSDYSKPLMIVWLCATCHRKLHAKAERSAQ